MCSLSRVWLVSSSIEEPAAEWKLKWKSARAVFLSASPVQSRRLELCSTSSNDRPLRKRTRPAIPHDAKEILSNQPGEQLEQCESLGQQHQHQLQCQLREWTAPPTAPAAAATATSGTPASLGPHWQQQWIPAARWLGRGHGQRREDLLHRPQHQVHHVDRSQG